ncbi:diphosphoinositol polyphosphate phosphohydrolase DDP1, partial [Striga asiatica]
NSSQLNVVNEHIFYMYSQGNINKKSSFTRSNKECKRFNRSSSTDFQILAAFLCLKLEQLAGINHTKTQVMQPKRVKMKNRWLQLKQRGPYMKGNDNGIQIINLK